MKKLSRIQRAIKTFSEHKGVLRIAQALQLGIHPEVIYQMRSQGVIEQLSRGVYRLADFTSL